MKVREILKDFNSSFLELSVSTRDFNYIFRRHKMFGEQDGYPCIRRFTEHWPS